MRRRARSMGPACLTGTQIIDGALRPRTILPNNPDHQCSAEISFRHIKLSVVLHFSSGKTQEQVSVFARGALHVKAFLDDL